MKQRQIDAWLFMACIGLAFFSIMMRDADKAPLYFILAYVFWRMRQLD